MRLPRLLPPPTHTEPAFFHVFSRVVDRRFIFDPAERSLFLSLLLELASFCRVRLLSFAILSNHFHLLLEIPPKPPTHLLPGPDQILQDLASLSGHQDLPALRHHFHLLQASGDSAALQALLSRFHSRLYNLSFFIKLLKQRFTQGYNRRHHRSGTLWESRFHSVLVHGEGHALTTMAAYIDLNPVRAGLVQDPKDYPWCAYGLACAGHPTARVGIQRLASLLHQAPQAPSVDQSLELYRMHLFVSGDTSRDGTTPDGQPTRPGLSRRAVLDVLQSRGRLPVADYLRCRVRYFCDGLVYGGQAFVDEIFRHHRSWFGPRRRSGARRMRGLEGPGLYTVRDLRKDVFT